MIATDVQVLIKTKSIVSAKQNAKHCEWLILESLKFSIDVANESLTIPQKSCQ